MLSRRIFHQKGLFLAVQGIAWNSSDCFESFSPLNNIVTEGVITTWSNRMIFRLFKGHWMPLFEISLSINVIMCKSAMHCQSSNKSRPWPLFDEEWASSYSRHFTTAKEQVLFRLKKQNTKIANDIVKNWNNSECNEHKFKNTFSGYHINHKIPYRMIISTSRKNYCFLYFQK